MSTPRMPAAEHAQFDAICAPLEDFETLPTVKAAALPEDELEQRDEALDELILAGLVAPY
jgi:hypothetical protein